MMTEEGWVSYGLEAIDHVLQQGILWKQFREAVRIMQLIPHNHAVKHFLKSSRSQPGTPKGPRVQDRPLQISRYLGLPPLLAKEH